MLFAAGAGVGCGGGQTRGAAFDDIWPYDAGESVAKLAHHLAESPLPHGAGVAIGIIGNGSISGASLDRRRPWRFSHQLDSRPVIAGSVIVGKGAGELFALDARTGGLLWTRAAGGRLRGAGDDGVTTVVSLQATTGQGSIVLALRRDGSVIRQLEDAAAIGVPAVAGDLALLPWEGRFVTAYDLHEGEEIARLTLPSETDRAFAQGGEIFLAGKGVLRLKDWLGAASRPPGPIVTLPSSGLPGSPRWMRPGTEVTPVGADARDMRQLFARPLAEGPAGIDGGRFIAIHDRIVFGLDAPGGALAWIHIHDASLLGGAAHPGGFVLCDAAGRVTFLDGRAGTVAGSFWLGARVDACVVQADTLKMPPGPPAAPLLSQIERAIGVTDPSLGPVHQFLLHEMGKMTDERATQVLIQLAQSDRLPPALSARAEQALAARHSGTQFMLSSLARRYDFLAGDLSLPPIAPLSDALGAMNEKRAAPLLALHLNDPESPVEAVEHAAAALRILATDAEQDPLAAFFSLYRCADAGLRMENAVVSVAHALIRLGDRERIAAAAGDSCTSPRLRPRLLELLNGQPDRSRGGK
jgi:outer membrane protein assembly factor BamB